MPCRVIRYTGQQDWPHIKSWLAQREAPAPEVEASVRHIIAAVAERGDEALVEFTRQYDCPDFTSDMLAVPQDEIDASVSRVPETDLALLAEAADNIRRFHELQVQSSSLLTLEEGLTLGRLLRPVDRAGLYVPGGQGGETPLISSLLMNAIPAQVAGVQDIALVSPPRQDGTLNPYLLAAAKLLGIREIWRTGSAWAVAALALGTASVAAVDVIAGPGNIYVTTAKRLLIGQVGIDMIAGPSEIAILAQAAQGHHAPEPSWIAADMLSQAEHDPLASSLLVTNDDALGQAVLEQLRTQLELLPRNAIATRALRDWGAVIEVPDLDQGIALINSLAPEHLELVLADPWSALGQIRHAGAIFLGQHSPEPLGDYFAGPNHVLPTMGTARFSSGLSVENFCKKSSLIAATPGYTQRHGEKVARFARLEGLEAHARSVECRNQRPVNLDQAVKDAG